MWLLWKCSVPSVGVMRSCDTDGKPMANSGIGAIIVACERRIFLLQYHNTGRLPEVKRQIVEMALNGSGIRDTARVLRISPMTVMSTLKKKRRRFTR